MTTIALDVSTTSTGIAIAKHNRIEVGTISAAGEYWMRAKQTVEGVLDVITSEMKEAHGKVDIYYEEVNVFINARTTRMLAGVLMPILYITHIRMGNTITPIQVIKARKALLKTPPYKKDRVFDYFKSFVENNDESDALAILYAVDPITAKGRRPSIQRAKWSDV